MMLMSVLDCESLREFRYKTGLASRVPKLRLPLILCVPDTRDFSFDSVYFSVLIYPKLSPWFALCPFSSWPLSRLVRLTRFPLLQSMFLLYGYLGNTFAMLIRLYVPFQAVSWGMEKGASISYQHDREVPRPVSIAATQFVFLSECAILQAGRHIWP
jgi:hypothetical protein